VNDDVGLRFERKMVEKVLNRIRSFRGSTKPSAEQLELSRQQLKQTRRQLKQVRQQLRELSRDYLLCKMPARSICAEIGVHEGDFSEQILSAVEPEKLHLIDPWEHQDEPSCQESRYGNLGLQGQDTMDSRYKQVAERFARQVREGAVEIHRSFSDVAAGEFQPDYFDWVYIDGNHLYEYVKQDLELYFPKVKAGGYLTGDDYGVRGWWENGVQKAVDEFVSQRPDATLEVKARQFLIKKNA
jgi:hypothetical protein